MACEVIPAERLVRARGQRSYSISTRRLAKRTLREGELLYPHDPEAPARPRTWGECQEQGWGTARACPFVSCKHHLYLDVNTETGSIKLNFPDLDPDEMTETCSLAVAKKHPDGLTLETTGELLAITRERTRQYETRCKEKLMPGIVRAGL